MPSLEPEKRPLRILVLVYSFSDTLAGGDLTHSWNLSRSLAAYAQDVYVFSPHVMVRSALPKNLHVYKVPFGRLEAGYTHETMMLQFLFGVPLILWKRIDIIQVITPGAPPSPFAKFKIRPFCQTAASGWDYDDPRFRRELLLDRAEKNEGMDIRPLSIGQRIFRKCTHLAFKALGITEVKTFPGVDLWVSDSEIAKRRFEREHPGRNCLFTRLGYDRTIFKLPDSREAHGLTFTFITVAAIVRRKGLQYLIPAFKRLRKEFPESRLLIVGSSRTTGGKEIRALAAGEPTIVFHDPVPSPDVARLMQKSDAFVLASLGEPFGLVLLEAAACGLPIIATNSGGGAPEVVEEGKMGYLVEPASADALYEGMKKIIADKEGARRMGLYAAEVIKKYNWDDRAECIIDHGYMPLIEKNKKRSARR